MLQFRVLICWRSRKNLGKYVFKGGEWASESNFFPFSSFILLILFSVRWLLAFPLSSLCHGFLCSRLSLDIILCSCCCAVLTEKNDFLPSLSPALLLNLLFTFFSRRLQSSPFCLFSFLSLEKNFVINLNLIRYLAVLIAQLWLSHHLIEHFQSARIVSTTSTLSSSVCEERDWLGSRVKDECRFELSICFLATPSCCLVNIKKYFYQQIGRSWSV